MGSLLLKIAQLQDEQGQLQEALKSYESAETKFNKADVIVDGLKAKTGAGRVKAAIDKKEARP